MSSWCKLTATATSEQATRTENTMADEPNPPLWPYNVLIFSPDDDISEIKKKIKVTEDTQGPYFVTIKEEYEGTIRERKQEEQTYTSEKHFSSEHWALLFKPGEYKDCSFEVGYYVQVAGLGASAKDVKFTATNRTEKYASGPFVKALNKQLPKTDGGTIAYEYSGLALDTFWRAAENFYTDSPVVWAVSQAAPLRRVYIDSTLQFCEGGEFASGGVLANAHITGNSAQPWSTNFIAQQQWFSRGVYFGKKIEGGAWNIVLSGCSGSAPNGSRILVHRFDDKERNETHLVNKSIVVDKIPKIRTEKPFVTYEDNRYKLHVPKSTVTKTVGPDLDGNEDDVRDFNQVKLGIPNAAKDDFHYNILDENDKKLTDELQSALDQGKDLVLCPGTFFLTGPLIVQKPGQVILGLGLATLVAPKDGSPCIRVMPGVPGVRIAGITLEASVQDSGSGSSINCNSDKVRSLLEWGLPDTKDEGDAVRPGVLTDIFARVGGSNLDRTVSTDVIIRIHSSNVMGDNLWLWRADHMKLRPDGEKANNEKFPLYHQTEDGEAQVKNALIVNGDNVHMYGLFCEHTVEDQLIWNGNHGSVVFFQCELPYDVKDENFGQKNFVGYRVNEKVDYHEGHGVGVYSNFTGEHVIVKTGILHPPKDGIVFNFPFTVFLSNLGQISTVINHDGLPVSINSKGTPSRA